MMKALTHHSEEMLRNCTHLILDEVHERELENDLLSLIIKLVLKKFPSLKLVVMSATIQADLFLNYFATDSEIDQMDERVIFVGARRFPVDDFYLEDLPTIFPDAFDDEDQVDILKNACIFNKRPLNYYLDMQNSTSHAPLLGESFSTLSTMAKHLQKRFPAVFEGPNSYRHPMICLFVVFRSSIIVIDS